MLTIRAKAICIYSFIIVVCLISASYPLSAQQARDYFFPANGKNALVINAHHQGKSHHSKTIFYATTKGDSALMMTQYFDEHGARGGQEQTLQISDSVIKVVHLKANTSPGQVEAADEDYVIFKMPGEKTKSVWAYPNQKGTEFTAFESEFVTLKIHHKKVKAVKVLVKLVRKRSGKETDFYAEYYVPGMGLYKTTDPSGRVPVEVVAEQTYVKDIPQVK